MKEVLPPIDYLLSRLESTAKKLEFGIVYFWTTSYIFIILLFITLVSPILYILTLIASAIAARYVISVTNGLVLFKHFRDSRSLRIGTKIVNLSQHLIYIIVALGFLSTFINLLFSPFYGPFYIFYGFILLVSVLIGVGSFTLSFLGLILLGYYFLVLGNLLDDFSLKVASIILMIFPYAGSTLIGIALTEITKESKTFINEEIFEKVERELIEMVNNKRKAISIKDYSLKIGVPPLIMRYIVKMGLMSEKIHGYIFRDRVYPKEKVIET